MELNEKIAALNVADKKEKCPFCPNKNLDQCKTKKEDKLDTKVVSKPNQLACGSLVSKGEYQYTTAKHHLISAKQCYAKLKRLVRMGALVKYDINDPPNGIALPTVANNLRYTVGSSVKQKYGKLSQPEKKTVAFGVMASEKAQWHVGHHAVQVELPEGWADEEADEPWKRGHLVSYDTEVIKRLIKLLASFKEKDDCEEKKKPENFKKKMDKLSSDIKLKLNAFKGPAPSASSPFFVSQLAADFAKEGLPVKKTKPPRAKK